MSAIIISVSGEKKGDEKVRKTSRGHRCYICGQRFVNINILRKHVNVHKDRDHECEVCHKLFSTLNGKRKHMYQHTGERPYPCELCCKKFRQKCTLQDHMRNIHSSTNPKHYCVTCGKRIRMSEGTQCWLCVYEERQVTEVPNDQAEAVPDKDRSIETIVKEVVTESESSITKTDEVEFNLEVESKDNGGNVSWQPMSCIMCSEIFPSIILLREHINQTHKSSRPFPCDKCGLRFATHNTLSRHLDTHDEVRPYMCLTCSRCFKSNVTLQMHLNTHREDRPFTCKTCNASFKALLNLKNHQITHSTERPFECKDCGYKFKTLDRLKKHVIVHTGLKPYRCEKCFKEFRHPGNLGRHYYLHIGQRLYVCQICGKDFAQSVGLKQHEQVHDKEYNSKKVLSCPFCNKAYKLDLMLQRHIAKHHSMVTNLELA